MNFRFDIILFIYVSHSIPQEVRQQLIDKYLSLGRTQEYAEVEIDRFLNDPCRSQKFLEMRKYVKSQEDASMGFENFLLYGCAFIFGLLGDAIFKHLLSFQVSYVVLFCYLSVYMKYN